MKALDKAQASAAIAAYAAVKPNGGIITVWFDDEATYADFKADGTVIVEHMHNAESFMQYSDMATFCEDYGI